MRDSDFVKVAKALADPTRFRMLQEIRGKGSLNCSQVCGCFPLSQPTISHHIKALECAGLISIRKDGQYHVLTACETRLAAFSRALAGEEPVTPNAAPTPGDEAPDEDCESGKDVPAATPVRATPAPRKSAAKKARKSKN